MKPVAMVGWSGYGRFEDLETTALRKLAAPKGKASSVGGTLLVGADDPVAAARSLAYLPGVDWIAVGYLFKGTEGYLKTLVELGRRYVSKGRTFKISAQSVGSDQSAGDLVLAGNSELLSSVPGARVDERRPRARFRVSLEGPGGACGAEILAGPGGAPTGSHWVTCLVSGGERSSSMAWMTALSGYSVRLVHSMTDDEALRHVARLYSELSRRMDARCLELVLLKGEGRHLGRVGVWLSSHEGAVLAGLRPDSPDILAELAGRYPNLALPMLLVQEDSVKEIYRSLGLGRPAVGPKDSSLTPKSLEASGSYSESRFGGVEADANAVIDALKSRG